MLLQWALVPLLALNAQAQDDTELDAFVEHFTGNRNSIRQLEARFVQRTVTPDETYDLEGTIVYARTGDVSEGIRAKRLVFRYDDPPIEYMIDGLRAYEYDPELKQMQIFTLEDRPEAEALYLGFGSDTGRLTEAYDLRLQPAAEDNPGGVAVSLIPKNPKGEASFFEEIVLQLRAGDLLPVQIHIINDAESEVFYTVSGFVLSDTLDPEKTTLFVPAGTNIVEEDTFTGPAPEGGLRFPLSTPDRN